MSASAMRSSSSSTEPGPSANPPGGRGTEWVVAQFLVVAGVVAAGFLPPGWPATGRWAALGAGAILVVAGGAIAVWSARALGRSLTPFPRPLGSGLVTRGPFAVVRHPIYAGGLAFFVGYGLLTSIPALAAAVLLGLLWAAKVRVEERLLDAVYEGYADYRRAVRWRLIPLVY